MYAATISVKAYLLTSWPTTRPMTLRFLDENGTSIDASTLLRPSSGYSTNGDVATFTLTFCGPQISFPRSGTLQFQGTPASTGNAFCFTTGTGTLNP